MTCSDSSLKQQERQKRINDLPEIYHTPLTCTDNAILDRPIKALVGAVQDRDIELQKGAIEPLDILHAYGKKALLAHKETNCLTEVMIGEAEKWATDCNRRGPLAGIPVSLKDVSHPFFVR